jgi:hypothetical protein
VRIEDFLAARKSDILEKWFIQVTDAYSPDTAHFLKNQKDSFANPVGSNIREGLAGLLDHLTANEHLSPPEGFLDQIIRIRAVQTMFSPSQAVSFIFDLKKIIRDQLKKELKDMDSLLQLKVVDDRIDALGLAAFDIFVSCRERIYEIKANQEKNKVYRAFERAGLITEIQED